jgi:hypothetical protein
MAQEVKMMVYYHKPMFNPRPVCVEFGVDKLVLWFSHISLIPPMPHIHISCIYHRCQIILEIDSVLNKPRAAQMHIQKSLLAVLGSTTEEM